MPTNREKIKVGACQILTTEDVRKSTDRVVEKLTKAAAQEIEILSFPEGAPLSVRGSVRGSADP